MKSPLALVVPLAAVLLVGCGGSSQSWKEEFRSQVEEVIESTKQVSEATRLATGPADLRGPFAEFNEELSSAEEKLGELESAPSECASAEKHALGSVRELVLLSRESSMPKNYTPALLKNAKAHPLEAIEKLERDLSEAHC